MSHLYSDNIEKIIGPLLLSAKYNCYKQRLESLKVTFTVLLNVKWYTYNFNMPVKIAIYLVTPMLSVFFIHVPIMWQYLDMTDLPMYSQVLYTCKHWAHAYASTQAPRVIAAPSQFPYQVCCIRNSLKGPFKTGMGSWASPVILGL